ALTVLNPLLLLTVVSAAHLDGAMCVLLLGCVLAARRQHWAMAILLACAAGSIKAPAFLAVLALIVAHAGQHRGRRAWRHLALDGGVALVAVMGLSLLVRHGWGWIAALTTPGEVRTPLAPASIVATFVRHVIPVASVDDAAAGGRVAALAAAGCIGLYLLATARNRSLGRTIGYGLLAVALLSPVLYPWYLLGAVVLLAPAADGVVRDWLIALSAIACVVQLPGQSGSEAVLLNVIVAALTVCVIAALARRRGTGSIGSTRPRALPLARVHEPTVRPPPAAVPVGTQRSGGNR
ncbi:MAG: hypothetical protein ACRDU4_09455, partial [Mycobacterium sp.]